MRRLVLPFLLAVLCLVPTAASASETLTITVRGKALTLAVYRPRAGTPKGTVLVGSGDVGWVGLAADMSEFLASQGYCAVGINVRQYLGSFTSGKTTVTPKEVPDDYAAIASFLRGRGLLVAPVILSGVSEGAALAVLAGSADKNHEWIDGVLTMGLPPTAELGWRWTDFTSWVTKKDPDEPMFAPKDFLPRIAPIPLCLIHSTKDEYVTAADIQAFDAVSRSPKKLVLIHASNHRFTDRRDELKQQIMNCLAWMRSQGTTR